MDVAAGDAVEAVDAELHVVFADFVGILFADPGDLIVFVVAGLGAVVDEEGAGGGGGGGRGSRDRRRVEGGVLQDIFEFGDLGLEWFVLETRQFETSP